MKIRVRQGYREASPSPSGLQVETSAMPSSQVPQEEPSFLGQRGFPSNKPIKLSAGLVSSNLLCSRGSFPTGPSGAIKESSWSGGSGLLVDGGG